MQVWSPIRHHSIPAVPAGGARPRGPGATSAYLDTLDEGLVLIESDGRVALCSTEARRLLDVAPHAAVVGRNIRHLLGDPDRGRTTRREQVMARLCSPLRRREPVSIDLVTDGAQLTLDVRPLANAGWAVTVQDAATRAAKGSVGSHDALTGLPNRAMFRLRLSEALDRLPRGHGGFALLTVDLDRFKQVNDTLGHPVGDALLCKVGDRLRSALGPSDTVARLGGDEFAVLQGGVTGPAAAETLARRIVDLLGRAYVIEGHLVNIGASVGVALAPADGSEPDRLLKHADLALYRAKVDGRDTFRFFEPEMGVAARARRLLEIDLRRALALREFELVYQPQLNLETDRLVGCEALIRWHHPARGTVSPAEFIPLAEEIGLIVPIGDWVIGAACKEATRWPGDLAVAVHLSPAQFRSRNLVGTVASALSASGLPPHRLELEITEGVLLRDNDANLATLHALRDLGLRISVDDFGTGYSSLSYLRAFPFDKIKIDRSFVSGAAVKGDSMAIIRAIASLGASFGMTTVAEGVETPDQMRRIRDEGCTDVQGYLISRPVPAAAILQLFTDQSQRAPLPSHS